MRTLLLSSVMVVCAVGCGPDPEGTMGGADPSEPWEALDTFQQGGAMGLGYGASMGDWAGVQRDITSDSFKSALDAFEQSPVPDAYSDRQAAKDAMVQNFRDAIAAAGTGEFQAKYETAMQSMRDLRGIADDGTAE